MVVYSDRMVQNSIAAIGLSEIPYWQWVSLSVEHPFVQGQNMVIITKQKEEILECFC